MFIPFTLTMLNFSEVPYLWFFYKMLAFSNENNAPVIALEEYFNKPSYFAKLGQSVAYDKRGTEKWGFLPPKNKDIKKADKYSIPQALIDKLVIEKGSINEAFALLLTEVYEPLKKLLSGYFDEIQSKYNEKIEAVITLCHYPSLSAAAESKGIKVIHFEQGTFRVPTYINTGYFDFDNLYGGDGLKIRAENFFKEIETKNLPILNGKEIYSVMLQKDKLNLVEKLDEKPTHKIGVALGYATWDLFTAKSRYNDSELLYRVHKKVGDEMLVRRHPFDPYGAMYPKYKEYEDDPKKTTLEFILSCESIATLGSNVAIEALLLGRGAYATVHCPAYYACENVIENEPKYASSEYLSFFVFGYLIPYEYITDVKYLRWRLTNPPETDIYMKHLEFYFNKKGIPLSILSIEGENRFLKMLEVQGYHYESAAKNK